MLLLSGYDRFYHKDPPFTINLLIEGAIKSELQQTLMSLENREAYLKLPGNLPIAKVKFAAPTSKLICRAFIPIAGYKTPEETSPPDSNFKEPAAQE